MYDIGSHALRWQQYGPAARQFWEAHRAKLLLVALALVVMVVSGNLLVLLPYTKWLLLAGVAYFLPSVVAAERGVPHLGSVVVVNLFLGWTFLGWVVALAMACRTADSR